MAYNFWNDLFDIDNFWKPVGNAIGSGFKKVGNFFSGLWKDYTGQTNNQMNLDFQRENLDYQKSLQKEIFQREDSAYQRTVNDMRLAGLNPASMNGTNAAGEAIATSAPESTKTTDLQALGDIMNVVSQLNVNRNNNSLTQANANLINAQADNQKIKNIFEEDILSKTLEGISLGNIGKRFQNQRDNISWQRELKNLAFNDQFGISDNMPDFAKVIAYATHQGNLPKDWYKNQMPSDWSEFGRFYTSNEDMNNPSFSNLQSLLEKSNLKGAISESALGNMFLKLLGIN